MDLEQFYNEIKTDKEKFSRWDFPVLNLVEKRKKTLEIGSGSGFFAAHITKCDIPVTCVDLSDYNINKCRERGLSTFKVNIEKEPLPFHNDMFYQVVMVEVIDFSYC